MIAQVRSSAVALLSMTLLCGVVYPLTVTMIAKFAFPRESAGSLLEMNGRVVGSTLVGQPFDDPKYFWGRPSATTPWTYNAGSSTGSNMGPTNPALTDAVRARVVALRADTPDRSDPVPVDLVTASGSGLDPHVSPAGALYQVVRVARARKVDESRVRELVMAHVETPDFGVIGEPRVNVLALNVALDAMITSARGALPAPR